MWAFVILLLLSYGLDYIHGLFLSKILPFPTKASSFIFPWRGELIYCCSYPGSSIIVIGVCQPYLQLHVLWNLNRILHAGNILKIMSLSHAHQNILNSLVVRSCSYFSLKDWFLGSGVPQKHCISFSESVVQ